MPNVLQSFNDSQVGVVLGTVLHTVGAIAFLGGLVAYVAWHRQLRSGHHHRQVLDAAAFLSYFAIVVNLTGGFMRTWETGHPSITEFGSSAWVRAISVKHLFLFAAYGAAVFLFERVAPRLIKAHKEGALQAAPSSGHRLGVAVVTLGILVSAFLGALSTVLPIAAAEGEDDGSMDHGDDHPLGTQTLWENATGQLTSTPLQPSTAGSTFQVAPGTLSLNATLVWSPAQSQLLLELLDPSGAVAMVGADAGDGRQTATVELPPPGAWSFRIASELAVNVRWDVSIAMPLAGAGSELIANTVQIAPGAFYEINTQAKVNATLHWDWSAGEVLAYNIHTHFDGDVQYVVEEQAAASAGSYLVNRTGGHSYMWENTGTLPVTLTYRVWGEFTLDSIFP